uniref:Uncharacterized protein n=1 Tax=Meloidogyne enterolobii TaxID=390850 RepID=A0A6V7V8N5_MELEN|nr:unnamed protein product [Meloidogyne enterolobii]CAD2175730.1 unnamed protein product [Meloidogyne enterolobii]
MRDVTRIEHHSRGVPFSGFHFHKNYEKFKSRIFVRVVFRHEHHSNYLDSKRFASELTNENAGQLKNWLLYC